MTDPIGDQGKRIEDFIDYVDLLSGDEKGEAQVFCDRLFQAFGHQGYKEAGATLEYRIKKKSNKGTSYADLVWKPRVIIEMKKRGEKLNFHLKQAFDYWIHAVPERPKYVVLCNFDEFWIYDFDKQIDEPVDTVPTPDLKQRYTALNFLFLENNIPVFNNDREAVSRESADNIAMLFKSLTVRGIPRDQAQRFTLQLVISMFSEDIELLPKDIVYNIVNDCLIKSQSSYDLFNGLFSQMNSQTPAKGGRFINVPYFNGGIFEKTHPIDLTIEELELIGGDNGACTQDWSKINPAIFGTLFQQSMDAEQRHALGAHFTSEADILRIVHPTIVKPWLKNIENATTAAELLELRKDLAKFRVLDPSCGSGNFLYVSYRELVRVEIQLLEKIRSNFSSKFYLKNITSASIITPSQFFGIDSDPFAVELAKVTLMLAKKLALDEAQEFHTQKALPWQEHEALPLDNLDDNIFCDDALFCSWPEVDVIIGNPPYQSKNKMQQEFGRAYLNKLIDKFPEVDKRADYCVYWFRIAHDKLKVGQKAGLVGTNTIRQNYSRNGSLDYIVNNKGIITNAVSSMKWSGDAVVYVSIVNWIKDSSYDFEKTLYVQEDDNDPTKGWSYKHLKTIGSSLSFNVDVTRAKKIQANYESKSCYQGQTHGHKGFLLPIHEMNALIKRDTKYQDILFPYLIAEELIGNQNSLPTRCVIDFYGHDIFSAQQYSDVFDKIKKTVLPAREKRANEENERNELALKVNPRSKVSLDHHRALENWWQLFRARGEMLAKIKNIKRYIACGRVTKRPIFEFISSLIHPNDAMVIFPFDDEYSFGVLQSYCHWIWFINRCSTLKGDPRYTSKTVFDTFPWPQIDNESIVKLIASKAKKLRLIRTALRTKNNCSYRSLYRLLDLPGKNPLKSAHIELDKAVFQAYGINPKKDILEQVLDYNTSITEKEKTGEPVLGPGIPPFIKDKSKYISSDCISMK